MDRIDISSKTNLFPLANSVTQWGGPTLNHAHHSMNLDR